MAGPGAPRRVSRMRQLLAVLEKNYLLQTSRRGWAGLLVQVLLPAAFFAVMMIPKHFIPPVVDPEYKEVSPSPLIDSRWWSGAIPYSGRGFSIKAIPGTLPRRRRRQRRRCSRRLLILASVNV